MKMNLEQEGVGQFNEKPKRKKSRKDFREPEAEPMSVAEAAALVEEPAEPEETPAIVQEAKGEVSEVSPVTEEEVAAAVEALALPDSESTEGFHNMGSTFQDLPNFMEQKNSAPAASEVTVEEKSVVTEIAEEKPQPEIESAASESVPVTNPVEKKEELEAPKKSSKPDPTLTYEKVFGGNEKKDSRRRPIRETLDREPDSARMDEELAGWADKALGKGKMDSKVEKKSKAHNEKPKANKEQSKVTREKPKGKAPESTFLNTPQNNIRDLVEKAFRDEHFDRIRGGLGNLRNVFKARADIEQRLKGKKIDVSRLSKEEQKLFKLSEAEQKWVTDIRNRYESQSHKVDDSTALGKVKKYFKKFFGI